MLADGVLTHLSSPPLPPASAAAAAAGVGSFDGGDDVGGGAGWWDAREGALARLAATLVTRLRAVARGGAYGGPSTAEVDAIGGRDSWIVLATS